MDHVIKTKRVLAEVNSKQCRWKNCDGFIYQWNLLSVYSETEFIYQAWNEGSFTGDPERYVNPYPTAFPYGNGMVLHFYQQQESSTTKTVHKVINKGIRAYV